MTPAVRPGFFDFFNAQLASTLPDQATALDWALDHGVLGVEMPSMPSTMFILGGRGCHRNPGDGWQYS